MAESDGEEAPAAAVRVAGVVLLMALSVWLRSHALTAKFWIDEGLSVGVAQHGFFDIPSVLRKDGSPHSTPVPTGSRCFRPSSCRLQC